MVMLLTSVWLKKEPSDKNNNNTLPFPKGIKGRNKTKQNETFMDLSIHAVIKY
jgi:hypothetical protein